MKHVPFHASFTGTSYHAITDGAMRSKVLDQINACVEVQKVDKRDAVQMQETAQVVGWLMKESCELFHGQ